MWDRVTCPTSKKIGKMRCKIAELIVEVPEGLASRCEEYRYSGEQKADIVILQERYRPHLYQTMAATPQEIEYQETACQFAYFLLNFEGFYLHASAVELEGRAYLFAGPSGIGKSTHTRLWQQLFGKQAQVFNDDKPALRRRQEGWFAYGTPWCGKDGINLNRKVPLAGICFLKRGEQNSIRRLTPREAVQSILSQSFHKFIKVERLDKMLSLVDRLLGEIPVWELACRPEEEAALLSYETMRRGAEEMGLCD